MSKGSYAQGLLIGRMGKAIEVRSTQAGKKLGSFSVACTSGWGDRETTSWFNVNVLDERKVTLLEQWGGKGKLIMVIGELAVRKFNHNGVDRESTEVTVGFEGSIQLLGSKSDNPTTENSNWAGAPAPTPTPTPGPAAGGWGEDPLDDEVPF